MDKLLTIVIAAYNKESVLSRCLDSLIVEPSLMRKVQVLVINDGSKDRTLQIAREYEQKYRGYISAIDKPNGNYGSVMNKGLTLAEGKYFRTLDADDWYNTKAYADFLHQLSDTDADMIINERYNFFEKDHRLERLSFKERLPLDKDIKASASIWSPRLIDLLNVQHIIYKTSLIKESGLKWIEKISYTDTMFDYWPLRLVKTVRFMALPVYIYSIGTEEQSMSLTNIKKNFNHFVLVANALIDDWTKHYSENSSMYPVQEHFVKQICQYIYSDLINGNQNLPTILKLHKKLDCLPRVKKNIITSTRWHSIHYLKDLDRGALPLSFKILRTLSF